jgi:alkylation response protein AidB-like acyl-CoA dehydrogenase
MAAPDYAALGLTTDQEDVLLAVREFVEGEILPRASEYEAADRFPDEIVHGLRELGLFGFTIPERYGGMGLDLTTYCLAVEEISRGWMSVSGIINTHFICSAMLLQSGTDEQKERLLPRMATGEVRGAFSMTEPHCGSDVQAIRSTAVRDGDAWVVNGQKVWSSGAQFADWGELIARTDPDVPKHKGLTAFLLPMDTPGVVVRPLRQMSGGSSFCEVFLDDVVIPDALRLGEVGAGWGVTLATLGFERGHSGANADLGGGFTQLVADARMLGRTGDPDVRRVLADVWVAEKVAALSAQRDRETRLAGGEPGPIGSLRKLAWAQRLKLVSDAAAVVLGPRLVADAGDGSYRWTEHYLGAPGYRIAGGSDEIQRTIIAERLLGLPPEPRADRGVAWKDIPR